MKDDDAKSSKYKSTDIDAALTTRCLHISGLVLR